ncbi:MAG: NAD(P)H-dependent glycerol-3-phosphate dehydrogenase [Lachnospiraceae bacterium]|nr:NAD(P)H-dependent glycerol-3-phosphate dehydrogenase [Lachnospiraceae bacterium]
MAKVSVLGAGAWGVALGILLAENGNDVIMWTLLENEAKMLKEERENKISLPGVKLHDSMKVTTDLEEAVRDRDVIVLATASRFIRSTSAKIKDFVKDKQIIVNVSKGIEESTLMTMTDIISEEIPGCHAVVLSGPSHAEEVGRGLPTTCVVGAEDMEVAKFVQDIFMNNRFRVYTSPDILGIELGGSLKNVIALAAGMADGIGCGDNTKAALITRGMAEITRLGLAMGGKAETFSGLTGIGDLIVTCASMHSRNRRAGILIGEGKTMDEAMTAVNQVVEGVYSAKAAILLSEKYNVSMPIVSEVNKVLFENKSVRESLEDLMVRDKTTEIVVDNWK